LENWRHYLEGAKVEFKIWTDYKNLQYFMSSQKLNHRQARWALYLSRFNFVLKHILGKSMGKVDSLSRRPDWQEGVERDNENRVVMTHLGQASGHRQSMAVITDMPWELGVKPLGRYNY